ncbi:type 1 periplasmic-binding domain-containing protein [Nocardiopsis trehalosi]|jgi:hypothetical protein|uniref:hypothetical protein n=1 Tax=Nocardiopsis trehalosi TaxID=109329 RepID=UPI00082F356B|nr:hypothetical protein [Nocardiopsis trehalosi]
MTLASQGSVDGAAGTPAPPSDVSAVLGGLRARPPRAEIRRERRAERRADRRFRYRFPGRHERGDTLDPPPVLDLVVDGPAAVADAAAAVAADCGPHPHWIAGPAAGPGADGAGDGAADALALYARLRAMAEEFARPHGARPGADGPEGGAAGPWWRRRPAWWWRDPRPLRLRRVESLLLLTDRVSVRRVHNRLPTEEGGETGGLRTLARGRRTEVLVMDDLRTGGDPRPAATATGRRLRDTATDVLQAWARFVGFFAESGLFGWIDNRLITPLSFVMAAVVTVGAPSFLVGSLTAFNTAVTYGVTVVLAAFNVSLFAALFLPWRRFAWLGRHRYLREFCPPDAAGGTPFDPNAPDQPTHRDLGIGAINAYHLARHAGEAADAAEGEDAARAADAIARVAVNAFLDDLDAAYGSTRWEHRWLPRRHRSERPVLVLRGDADATGRALVRRIERERFDRRLPDPLLIVRVGTREGPAALPPPLDPEGWAAAAVAADGTDGPDEAHGEDSGEAPRAVQVWRRARHAAGRLGVRRAIALDASGLGPPSAPAQEAPPPRVRSGAALAVNALAGVAVGTAVGLVLVLVAGPVVARAVNPCVAKGALTPVDGVFRQGEHCVGWTYGSFAFDDRLESVQDRIAEQNADVAKSDKPHVTVAYVGELSVADAEADRDRLAGVHGELAGLAIRQAAHNAESDGGTSFPQIRLMLVNAGPRWSAAVDAARRVTAHARDDDTLLAAVGFGTSVEANTAAIREFTRAGIPMIGSTATYDAVAEVDGRPSPFFFPIAPSNTRIARQAAYWAFYGAERTDDEGVRRGLEPAATAMAIADDSAGETYGMDLAATFMAEFARLAGGDPAEGVVPYDADAATSLRDAVAEVCADPPELVYFAGRSDDFRHFYGRLQSEGACAEGVAVLGSDDIAKYVTDHVRDLGRYTDAHPVYYTPLAASGTWGLTGGLDERGFYAELDDLSADLDLDEEQAGDRPSAAHAAIGHDTLTVVAEAIGDAQAEQYGDSDRWGAPASLEAEIRATAGVVGVSGLISFSEGDGHWYDDKLIQLALAGPEERQHVVGACGWITPRQRGDLPESNCRP